ncbi:hypothetical protein L9G74_15390 [Shewanella sp. C32]|uniref:Uncharacterized protein n=1 Tax=Shewanella electrica TaxID=515560 RepID=A0ABT2FNB9_9GAMM|nr:hypothetical protein [Shewanella electrica]MCH1926396.1 hypothetical protein [Shewanella electrica]MCS4557833.1 hypothetical protein [Shewanella electrica]
MKSALYFKYQIQLDNYGPRSEELDVQHDTALNIATSLETEIARVKELNPAMFYDHVEQELPTEWNQTLAVFEKFKQAVQSRVSLQKRVEELLQQHQGKSKEYEQCLACLLDLQQRLEYLLSALFYCVGQHNKAMADQFMFETGLNKIQSEQLKAMAVCNKKYGRSLSILVKVLGDFYANTANYPYPLSKVIEWIELRCINAKIPFPKDRKSELLQCVIDNTIPQDAGRNAGAPKQEFRQLPEDQLATFAPLFQ